MTVRFEGVAIIGVGLLGASLGLALKQQRCAGKIIGIGRNHASLEIALRRGAVDEITLDVAAGVADAALVVIATPARSVTGMLDHVLAAAPSHTVITDVASAKGNICAHARRVCPAPRRFVGGHPMAGSEQYGPENSSPELYRGSVCLVEQDNDIDGDAREQVCALWNTVGARVVDMDAATHDAVLARTSHAPHVLAAALALVAGDFGAHPDMAGNGFRDATRIAESRPEIWRDICLENRQALGETLASIQEQLRRFEACLEAGDAETIEAFFKNGAEARRGVLSS